MQGWNEGRRDDIWSCIYLCWFFVGYSVVPDKSLSLEWISGFTLFLYQLNFGTGIGGISLRSYAKPWRRKRHPAIWLCIYREVVTHPASDSKKEPSGNVSMGDDRIPGSPTSSCGPVGLGLLQALFWIVVALEEEKAQPEFCMSWCDAPSQCFWTNG